jgi:hypothetical protein
MFKGPDSHMVEADNKQEGRGDLKRQKCWRRPGVCECQAKSGNVIRHAMNGEPPEVQSRDEVSARAIDGLADGIETELRRQYFG